MDSRSGKIIYTAGNDSAGNPPPPGPDGAMYSVPKKRTAGPQYAVPASSYDTTEAGSMPVYQEAMQWRADGRAQPASAIQIRGHHAKLDETMNQGFSHDDSSA